MFKINAVKREQKGEKVRVDGLLPAVIYGAGGEADSVSLTFKEFNKVYQEAGDSTLIDLEVDGKAEGKVLVQDVQYDPVKDRVIHVDLKRIDMNKTLVAPVELIFIGESQAIKEAGGTLVRNFEMIDIECLPKDLVSHLDVDLSVLKTFDDAFRVSDLNLPAGVKFYEVDDDAIIVKAVPALTEEEIKAMESESTKDADLTKIESAEPAKEAKEGEEAAAEAGEEKKEETKKE
ncbi:MAG: 50S ribosomal protein L25 [Candidatus Magasanikbacteria bacterium CG10_big_fil_rev_8_21_14_0_10_36_32]|uniref:Large ribosomal subunit protein bL25 n=1 Tax=Candidatus Magasanikbacteria bacterium CG10_big_fil_rev_8_21_14_0_10_36_32 TaxID=1974646 RepID=A0A2M6W6E4_9BACT|nr:MAG: 50S ribosomal protein L25 [Candidatus Magasanikbacteria bacterium CG10_big_fil_rev_8_21_14_0_10_36_32]